MKRTFITRPLLLLTTLIVLIVLAGCATAAQPMRVPTASPLPAGDTAGDTAPTATPALALVPTPTPANTGDDTGDTEPPSATAEPSSPSSPPSSFDSEDVVVALQDTLQAIHEEVSPSVVHIRVLQQHSGDIGVVPSDPFANPDEEAPDFFSEGFASGFVWDTEGHIVTNNHVVEDADRVTVTFSDGTVAEADVIGTDVDSDLAVVKVDMPADQLQPIEVSSSQDVNVGQLVIVFGNPFGLNNTMTVGFVSALGRSLPVDDGSTGPRYSIPDIIQTDASINPGNSGGAMVDDQGRLIGVPSAIRSPVQASVGVGFAIPSDIVQQVVPSLIESGTYEHSWLGVSGRSMTPDIAQEMGLDPNQHGALVIDVATGGPSDEAGVRGSAREVVIDGIDTRVGGDVIIGFDGRPVNQFDDIIAYLARYTSVGQTVTLTVLRDGEEQEIDVTLGERPSREPETATPTPQPVQVWLGIQGLSLTPAIASEMDLSTDQQGVLVVRVEANSPADEAGMLGSYKDVVINGERVLIGGDIIVGIDGEAVQDIDDLKNILAQAEAGQEVTISLLREGSDMELDVTLVERP